MKHTEIVQILSSAAINYDSIKVRGYLEEMLNKYRPEGLDISLVPSEDLEGWVGVPSNEDNKLQRILSIRDDFSNDKSKENLLHFAMRTRNFRLLSALLPVEVINKLTDTMIRKLIADAFEALLQGHYAGFNHAYQIIKSRIDADTISQHIIKKMTLLEADKLSYHSPELALILANLHGDLAYLFKKINLDILRAAKDVEGNNVLHLAMRSKNKYIIQYLVDHYGQYFLYQANEQKPPKTPIHIAYELTKAKDNDGKYDFSLLAMLDQLGADLNVEEYSEIYAAYQNEIKDKRPYVLAEYATLNRYVDSLSFNGGGVKGIAFVHAIDEAQKQNIFQLSNIRSVAGTSAGSLMAGLLALGYDEKGCKTALDNFKFDQLMRDCSKPDSALIKIFADNANKWRKIFAEGKTSKLLKSVAYEVFVQVFEAVKVVISSIPSFFTQGVGVFKRFFDDFVKSTETTGIFEPKYAEEKLIEHISESLKGTYLEKLDPKYLTLKDLQLLRKEYPARSFKELTVYVTNYSTGESVKVSAETMPNASLLDALIASMSFPIYFVGREIRVVNGEGEELNRSFKEKANDEKSTLYCDGGVLKNDPVDAHDIAGFNENVLAFLLVNTESKNKYENKHKLQNKGVKTLFDAIGKILGFHRKIERNALHQDSRNSTRIIYIDCKGVGTLDFDDGEKINRILEPAARSAIVDYLNRCSATGERAFRDEMVELLISYGCFSRPYIDGEGYVIKVHPNQVLKPHQVLRLYAAAEAKELPLLRSLVNPNIRDENNVSALTLSNALNWEQATYNLISAGANPKYSALCDATLASLPEYLKREFVGDNKLGESEFHNTLTEKELHQRDLLLREKEVTKKKDDRITALISYANTFKVERDSERNKSNELRIENTHLQQELAKLQQQNNTMQNQNAAYLDKNNTIRQQLTSFMVKLWRAVAMLNKAKRHNELLQAENGQLQNDRAQLIADNNRLQTQLTEATQQNTEFRSTIASLTARLNDNEAELRRVIRERNGSPVNVAIEALNRHRTYLAARIAALEALPEAIRAKKQAHLDRLRDKCQGMEDIINRLRSDFSQNASEIIASVKNNHAALFNSYYWGWRSRTRNHCYEIEQAENNINRAMSVTAG